jgi:nucleoside-diphosphate-sugar epimerase
MTSNSTILMTGATGFLGQYLLRDLLAHGARVVAMIRPPLAANIERLDGLLKKLDFDIQEPIVEKRLLFVEGSLPDRMPEPTWGRTDAFLSCAANRQLHSNGNGEPFKTNVESVEPMLEWTAKHGINSIHAVSTAYICGPETVDVPEAILPNEEGFHTDYEHSKWMAEVLLDKWGKRDGNVLTIYRPSLIVGDSDSGYTTQYVGFYRLARLASILKDQFGNGSNGATTHIPLRIPGSADSPQNFVPVDFTSRLIVEIMLRQEFHGRIFNLTDPNPPSNEFVLRRLEEYFRMEGGYFLDSDELDGERSPAESLLWDMYDFLPPRISTNPRFQMDNTSAVLKETGLEFPVMDRGRFFTLIDFAVSRKWGQRDAKSS